MHRVVIAFCLVGFLFACFVCYMAFPEIWASLVSQMVKNLCERPGFDP